ncbi:interleukin-1 receptor accessory protein-like isoform X1 [Acanthopagrus latus]|uniref:interleukin-1 receptor accessory protein-like isoform X1 n=1 Tax=Acanthopagrus latus TaxID=8177 RepID=UPI00187C807C|nr:interleukin-1 receptor accessory protein-like isoform X1 [Acanthopagrus latus]
MKLPSVVKALGSLCLLLADGFPVSEDESPKIIGPRRITIKAQPGQRLLLHCEAFANCEPDQTIIYWLINGSFPEDTPSSGRIVESEESTLAEGAILQRSLLLKNITSEDLKSTFTCVVTNAAGTAQKFTRLKRSGCHVGKNRKQ